MFVDSNILIYLLRPDSNFHSRAKEAFSEATLRGPIRINGVVYAEVCASFAVARMASDWLAGNGIEQEASSQEGLFRASRAFLQYKAAGGPRVSLLPDFFIGADAAVAGVPLLTNDPSRYRTYFPELELISP
jgi:predicted nucleic acid-binding protein